MTSTSPQPNPSRSRWGRVRFGRSRVSALVPAIPIGIGLAGLLAAVSVAVGFAPERPWLGAAILVVALAGPLTALVWALCVDRGTLRGAAERPEESVESEWYHRAAQGAFHDVLTLSGLALAALVITGTQVDGTLVLLGVLAVCVLSTGTRYVIHRQRG